MALTYDSLLEAKKSLDKLKPEILIDAILVTHSYLIPGGMILKAEHKNKKYCMMHFTDHLKLEQEYNSNRHESPTVLTTSWNTLGGIPVVEDDELIREIIAAKAQVQLDHLTAMVMDKF